jgi:hypothetical protein
VPLQFAEENKFKNGISKLQNYINCDVPYAFQGIIMLFIYYSLLTGFEFFGLMKSLKLT